MTDEQVKHVADSVLEIAGAKEKFDLAGKNIL
jgi:hypothetical protein